MRLSSRLALLTSVLSIVAIGGFVPRVIGGGAVNVGKLELSKRLLEIESFVDLGAPLTNLTENWMQLALRFDPQSQAVQALQLEIQVLAAKPEASQAFGQVVQWQHIGQQGVFALESGRLVNVGVQYRMAFALAERAYQGEDWKEAIKWYWRALAITPGEVPDLVRNHYYRTLAHVYLNEAKDTGVGHSYIRASKAFWMADRVNEAQVLADRIEESHYLTDADEAWVAFIRGQWTELQGDTAQAVALYRSSLSNCAGFPYSALALRSLAANELGRDTQKCGWLEGQTLPPPFDEVSLVGYILDEDVLAMGLDIPVLTLWKLPQGVEFAEDEAGRYSPIGDGRWVGYSVQRNLVRNSGFEWADWDQLGEDGILGWFKIGASACGCTVLPDPWKVRPGLVGKFISEVDGTQVIYLARRPLSVDSGTNYLGGGWMRAETNGSDHSVGGWMGAWWDNPSIGWFMSVAERQWTQRAQVLRSPDSAHITPLGMWVIPEQSTSGTVYIDDIFVIKLPQFVKK